MEVVYIHTHPSHPQGPTLQGGHPANKYARTKSEPETGPHGPFLLSRRCFNTSPPPESPPKKKGPPFYPPSGVPPPSLSVVLFTSRESVSCCVSLLRRRACSGQHSTESKSRPRKGPVVGPSHFHFPIVGLVSSWRFPSGFASHRSIIPPQLGVVFGWLLLSVLDSGPSQLFDSR